MLNGDFADSLLNSPFNTQPHDINSSDHCPVCGNKKIERFLFLEKIPATQNLLYSTFEEARESKNGNIDLYICKSCGFIHNMTFDAAKVMYTENYDNSQYQSDYFKEYIDRQINWLIKKYIKKEDVVIEVGCGKGYYIKKMAEKLDGPAAKYGFDLTYDGDENIEELNLKFFKDYFDDKYKHISSDVILCRHVIEHIENPIEFLRSLRGGLNNDAILFLETPNVNWIINNSIIYDFTYEHCSYFNKCSMTTALSLAGFEVLEIRDDFGGQYMWSVSKAIPSSDLCRGLTADLDELLHNYSLYTSNTKTFINTFKEKFAGYKRLGQTNAIWGAGGKGSMFVNLIDGDRGLVDFVIDINISKQCKYIGGTGHFVIPPDDIDKYGINNILVLNENYLEEINEVVRNMSDREINIFSCI